MPHRGKIRRDDHRSKPLWFRWLRFKALEFLLFIAGDIIKAIAAGITAWGITPKQAYNKRQTGVNGRLMPLQLGF